MTGGVSLAKRYHAGKCGEMLRGRFYLMELENVEVILVVFPLDVVEEYETTVSAKD